MKYLLMTTLLLTTPLYADNWDLSRDEKKVRNHMFKVTVKDANPGIKQAKTRKELKRMGRVFKQELKDIKEIKSQKDLLEVQDLQEYRANVRAEREGNKVMELNPYTRSAVSAREQVVRHYIKRLRNARRTFGGKYWYLFEESH